MSAQNNSYKEYRKFLMETKKEIEQNFDKTVLTLSTGALGITFSFLKDIIGPGPTHKPEILFLAWGCWTASTATILFSLYTSSRAFQHAMNQLDNGKIAEEYPGGLANRLTSFCNPLAVILFLIGVITMLLFIYFNLEAV